jgi:phage terminase Nu1 subunit (DNA packaging protein)
MGEILKTGELIEKIREEFGYTYDRVTVLSWARRAADPLPAVYKGRPGQSSRFDWTAVEPWLETEFEAQSQSDMRDIDSMDWMQARTMKERELAKQAQMETQRRAGELVSRREVELEAENLAATAAQMLLVIPDRISAVLAHECDETRVAQTLDQELRGVCNAIAESRRRGMDADDEASEDAPARGY